jgi:hypothetical protein
MNEDGRTMISRRTLGLAIAAALLLAGCGYIVTPEDQSTPTPAIQGAWTAVATKVDAAAGGLHVDITISNDTGAWSAMQATAGAPAVLKTGDGKSTDCASVFVGTGGTYLAPGFRIRGYTGGTKAKPETQLLYVECAGAAAATGSKLSVTYSYVTGDFNYYRPPTPATAKLDIDLDKVAADLTYPIATAVAGVIEPADTTITAINNSTLVLKTATRTADGLDLAWETTNPTEYPVYVHIGNPPVVGSDGVIYGFYESPHLADTPITPAGQSAHWTTKAPAPKDAVGLYILVMVESKQQKTFVNHAIDITDK